MTDELIIHIGSDPRFIGTDVLRFSTASGSPALRFDGARYVADLGDSVLFAMRDWLNTHLPEQPTVPADAVQFDDMETAR